MKKILSLSVFIALFSFQSNALSIDVISDMGGQQGNISLVSNYASSGSEYSVNIDGFNSKSSTVVSKFQKSTTSPDTFQASTDLNYERGDGGSLNMTEKVGMHKSFSDDTLIGTSYSTYDDIAVGVGIARGGDTKIASKTSTTDSSVSYSINKAQGIGDITVSAKANSFEYPVNSGLCSNNEPIPHTNIQSYSTTIEKNGVYDYVGQYNIGK
jgi:hypothetical protein